MAEKLTELKKKADEASKAFAAWSAVNVYGMTTEERVAIDRAYDAATKAAYFAQQEYEVALKESSK